MDSLPEGRYISFVLRVKSGEQDADFNSQITLADGRKIGLVDGAYTVRVWLQLDGRLVRGTIHHEETGQSLHFQSGDRVAEFIQACLSERPGTDDPEPEQSP